jgi:magnesium chelatase subunit I
MKIDNILSEPLSDILGQEKVKEQVRGALLMNRHIAVFGPPGIGKTTLAKNIARLLPEQDLSDCGYNCLPTKPVCPACRSKKQNARPVKGIDRFVRIQGSPDLTTEDLLGDIDPVKAIKYGSTSIEAFTPGKIFKANNGVLFFDELNRCPEKLQNALLQVLEERKATLGSYDVDIDTDFIFIATMNPQDTSTEKLSDVLLDRFDVIYMSYPESLEIEKAILEEKAKSLVKISKDMKNMIVGFVRSLREDKNLEKLPSVRATIGLYERAHANAYMREHKEVEFKDVLDAVRSVISHRIRLKPSIKYIEEPGAYVDSKFEKFVEENYPNEEQGGDG